MALDIIMGKRGGAMQRKGLIFAIIISMGFCLFAGNAFSELTPTQKHKQATANKIKKADKKKYDYIRTRDLNQDGRVDAKERQIWAGRRKSTTQPTLVSKEDEDIFAIMDTDNNGSVGEDEMQAFYSTYDINSNGILENSEISAAME